MEVRIPCNQLRPMPDDFPRVAPTMSLQQLRLRYHCAARAIYRWCRECGVDYIGRTSNESNDKDRIDRPPKPKEYNVAENPEVIDTCLFCPYPANLCRGHCDRLTRIKAELADERGDLRSKHTSEQKAWMIERHKEGYTMAAIAKFTGININTVARCCSGAPPRPKRGTLPPLESMRDEWDALR